MPRPKTSDNWLRHAFAIDPEGPAEPNESQRVLVEKVCAEVVRRRLTTPALLLLEMHQPFHYLSAQVLTFFQPFVAAIADTAAYAEFTAFLERRGSVEYLVARLQALEESALPPQPQPNA